MVSRAISQPELLELNHCSLQTKALKKEFRTLHQQPYFGKFDPTVTIETLNFDDTTSVIKSIAPIWHDLLTELLQHQRFGRPSHKKAIAQAQSKVTYRSTAINHQLFMITSMICMSQSKQKSNFFSCILDVYLAGSGVKRRVIETLSGLGICHSYHTVNRLLKDIASNAKVCEQKDLLLLEINQNVLFLLKFYQNLLELIDFAECNPKTSCC
jgi:hypothetical protein